jgi:periplasmic copper chaperone A
MGVSKMKKTICTAMALAVCASSASAHVVFADREAKPGSYYAGFLRVGHGCENSPTVAIEVTIPEGVLSARPQPLPGWSLKIEREARATPIKGEDGTEIRDRVKTITWSGLLPPDQFQQFGLMMKLPEEPGALYFPTVQRCKTGINSWTETPPAPAQWHDMHRPAPMLILTAPDEPGSTHQH